MPQMMPLNWIPILFLIILVIMIFFSCSYFNYFLIYNKNKNIFLNKNIYFKLSW